MMRVLSYISDHLGILSVLLAVSVLAVLFLCLYMRERRKCKAAGDEVSEEREFYRLVACNRGDVHMLIRREDLRVMYVSPNLREVAGIEAEAVRADIEVLKEAVSRGTARKVVRLLKGWDGTGTFESELDFRVIGGDRTGRGKLCVVCTEAVSYTHLDVYKRQAPGLCINRCLLKKSVHFQIYTAFPEGLTAFPQKKL